jgi:hypothetical protein
MKAQLFLFQRGIFSLFHAETDKHVLIAVQEAVINHLNSRAMITEITCHVRTPKLPITRERF